MKNKKSNKMDRKKKKRRLLQKKRKKMSQLANAWITNQLNNILVNVDLTIRLWSVIL